MDFVRAQMTDAERAAEQQYELVQAAVIEGVRKALRPPPVSADQIRMNAWNERRERDVINRRNLKRRQALALKAQQLG
jgi:hypothetical protein